MFSETGRAPALAPGGRCGRCALGLLVPGPVCAGIPPMNIKHLQEFTF
jgi:hypothetical protein